MYLLSCLRDESVLPTEVLLYIAEVEQVAAATGPACDAGGVTENSHQPLQFVQVGLALLHTLGHTAHQITRAEGTHHMSSVTLKNVHSFHTIQVSFSFLGELFV